MKSSGIHLWAAVILLVSNGFSPIHGSAANLPTIFLAGLTVAGMGACEYLLRSRRPAPVMVVVAGHSRN